MLDGVLLSFDADQLVLRSEGSVQLVPRGENIKDVLRHSNRLDLARLHAARNYRALEQIAAKLGKQSSATHRSHLVSGPAHSL